MTDSREPVALGVSADVRGVGLRTDVRELMKPGLASAGRRVVGECAIAGLTLAMVLLAAKRFSL